MRSSQHQFSPLELWEGAAHLDERTTLEAKDMPRVVDGEPVFLTPTSINGSRSEKVGEAAVPVRCHDRRSFPLSRSGLLPSNRALRL